MSENTLAKQAVNRKLKTLMQNLIYPAFLGTFLYTFSMRWLPTVDANEGVLLPAGVSFVGFLLWLLTLLYFVSLYVETETTNEGKYSGGIFVLDVLEILCMTVAFWFLAVRVNGGFPEWARGGYYVVMAIALMLPVAWRLAVEGRFASHLTRLCLIGIGWFVAAACALFLIVPVLEAVAVLGLWIVLLFHYRFILKKRPTWARKKSGEAFTIDATYRFDGDVPPETTVESVAPKSKGVDTESGKAKVSAVPIGSAQEAEQAQESEPAGVFPQSEAGNDCYWRIEKVSSEDGVSQWKF